MVSPASTPGEGCATPGACVCGPREDVNTMSFALSRLECERFLAETHVGVFSVTEEGRGPLSVPIWYRYEPRGDIVMVTPQTSRKIPLLQKSGRGGFCVQDERPPFRYVSVEGSVRIDKVDTEPIVREAAIRYLGRARGEKYVKMTAADRAHEVVVRLTPKRWFSADFESLIPSA